MDTAVYIDVLNIVDPVLSGDISIFKDIALIAICAIRLEIARQPHCRPALNDNHTPVKSSANPLFVSDVRVLSPPGIGTLTPICGVALTQYVIAAGSLGGT